LIHKVPRGKSQPKRNVKCTHPSIIDREGLRNRLEKKHPGRIRAGKRTPEGDLDRKDNR